MIILEAHISEQVYNFLDNLLSSITDFHIANNKIYDIFKINNFFDNDADLTILKNSLTKSNKTVNLEKDRSEYGDFQTNSILSDNIVKHLFNRETNPNIIIEPTCGKGNFIISSLFYFNSIETIYGIEIYKPYIWETKFNIIDFYITNQKVHKPEINIIHSNIFDFDFTSISQKHSKQKLLLLGNLPWVTNSALGTINSTNLPQKSNLKNQNGLDALTGKGNFDISEYIIMNLFDSFQFHNAELALLIKNSVIRNIIYLQKEKKYHINNIEQHTINSQKEFQVSVDASLFHCALNSVPSAKCTKFDFYTKSKELVFGWQNSKFVSDFEFYDASKSFDGKSPFEWRQGVKHDCANIMELKKSNEYYVNKSLENINLEDNLVYGLLKSSDLKETIVNNARLYTIITQTKIGEDTSYIQYQYPAVYNYLIKNISFFEARKSKIYNGKPLFSIFGIGDYSFKPYKVAISGLYKTYHFTLVLPQDSKPLMLDDTCYFIGFDRIEDAVFTFIILNHSNTKNFLKSITFIDSKRVFTKDILMRLDIFNIASSISKNEIEKELALLKNKLTIDINTRLFDRFLLEIKAKNEKQVPMFS